MKELTEALATPSVKGRTVVLVVDDGSRPEEAEKMREAVDDHGTRFPYLLPLLSLPENRGKGGAVYAGWDAAPEGVRTLAFVDADGAISGKEVARLLRHYHAPAGPGRAGAALYAVRQTEDHRVRRTLVRRFLGGLFARIVRVLFRFPVPDTQCGFKIVPKAAYERVKTDLAERRFIFDIELTYRLREAGVPLRHEPVAWEESPGSTLRTGSAARMLIGVILLRLRIP